MSSYINSVISIIVTEKLAIVRNAFEVETMKNEGNICNKI